MIHLLLIALLVLSVAAPADAQAIRKNVNDLSASEVMALRRGVAVMKARNSADRDSANWRRSWVFWANAHGHFSSDEDECRGPIGDQLGVTTIRQWTASNTAERRVWCRCQHGVDQFLTWHRMFLWYFERVLRQAAGSSTLRLPYWDERADGRLPAIYRAETYINENGNTVPNPLHVADRRPALNAGTAALADATTRATNAMAATTYSGFRSRIESSPHGAVHCAIAVGGCPNGIMGSVPVSANDPLFWAHHAEIDRTYDCWLRAGTGRLPADPNVLDESYWFVDRDGSLVRRAARDMLTTGGLGYRYATGSDCGGPTVASTAAAAPVRLTTGDRLADGATVLDVHPGGHLLRLGGVQIEGMVEVILTGPKGEANVGVISSFALDHHSARALDFEVGAALVEVGAAGTVGVAFRPISGTDEPGRPPPAKVRFRHIGIQGG